MEKYHTQEQIKTIRGNENEICSRAKPQLYGHLETICKDSHTPMLHRMDLASWELKHYNNILISPFIDLKNRKKNKITKSQAFCTLIRPTIRIIEFIVALIIILTVYISIDVLRDKLFFIIICIAALLLIHTLSKFLLAVNMQCKNKLTLHYTADKNDWLHSADEAHPGAESILTLEFNNNEITIDDLTAKELRTDTVDIMRRLLGSINDYLTYTDTNLAIKKITYHFGVWSLDRIYRKHILKLFPSAIINDAKFKFHGLGLSYERTIDL